MDKWELEPNLLNLSNYVIFINLPSPDSGILRIYTNIQKFADKAQINGTLSQPLN